MTGKTFHSGKTKSLKAVGVAYLAVVGMLMTASIASAEPKVVSGPSPDAACFKPWDANTQFFQYTKKNGPYRIALANGFIANTWRIQMIKTAKAFAEKNADLISEFKVVSTGEDLPAQIAAVENFINSGYDAVIVNALNPAAFKPAVKKANAAGVVLISFDNVIESDEAIVVNVDQVKIGSMMGEFLASKIPAKGAKVVEVRGPSGNSVDRDRHDGFRRAIADKGADWEVVEVVGKWDDGTAQKAVADAIAVHKQFDAIYVQGGSTGAVRALMDAGHPFVPVAGETENGFRKLCGANADKGLDCASSGTGPAQVAVAIKAALSALQGEPIPQAVALPVSYTQSPDFEDGKNYFSKQSDNFFVGNEFPDCNVGFTANEIMGQTESNN